MAYYSPFKIRMASHAIHQGQLIAYPTEAVYGLGCDPLNKRAVLDLLALKQRPIEKGLIIVASNFTQLLPFIVPDRQMLSCMMATWPGPVTWVVPARPWVPMYLRGQHYTLAVRVSAHPIIQQLCRCYGRAIVSTSANLNKKKNLPARPWQYEQVWPQRRCLFFLRM